MRRAALIWLIFLCGPSVAQPGAGFADFVVQFRDEALAGGVSATTYDGTMAGLTPDPRVPDLVESQPEFTTPIWDYLDGRLTPSRIERGKAAMARHGALLPPSASAMASIPICSAPSGAWKPIMAAYWAMTG